MGLGEKSELMKLFFIFIVFCLTLSPAVVFGSLGDNELKISQAYGNPTGEQVMSQSLMARYYRFNGMAITVTFLNGTSQCEEFKRVDGAVLADDQIQFLLEENSNHLSWTSKSSSSGAVREWIIAGPAPSADSSTSSKDQAVLAVSPKHVSAEGTKMVAVGVFRPDDNSSSAPSAPAVLRRAVYKCAQTNNVLAVFTCAYESVSKHELTNKTLPSVSDK